MGEHAVVSDPEVVERMRAVLEVSASLDRYVKRCATRYDTEGTTDDARKEAEGDGSRQIRVVR
jgi:hypothetical protein